LREGRTAAVCQVGLLATAVPSPREAIDWAAGPGATPDVILFDDWRLNMSAADFGTGMSEALGELTPPIVYIVSGEGQQELIPSPPFRPGLDICLRRPVPEHEVLEAVLSLVQARSGSGEALSSGADISERKRAEEELGRIEHENVTVLNSLSELVIHLDAGMRILWANRAAGEAAGMAPEELVGRYCYEIWHQRNEPCEQCPVIKARQTGQTQGSEITTPDDRVWSIKGNPIRDANGELTGIVEVISEITERRQAEEALRESEEKYRRLVHDSTDGIVIVGGIEVRFANSAMLKMFGCQSEEEMVGGPFTEFVSAEHRDLMAERGYAREKEQEVPARYEFKALRRDGSRFDAEISVGRIIYQGKVARQGIIRDITERKRAEEALRQSEQRLREVLEVSRDCVYKHNLDTGAYEYVSPAVLRLTGFTSEEFIAMGLEEVQERIHPEDCEQIKTHLDRLLSQSGEAAVAPTLQYRWRCKDGEYRWFSDNPAVIRDKDERPVAMVGTTRDITQRKQAQEALQESEERFRRLSESTFEGIVIHDRGRILDGNQAFVTMFGYELTEAIGMHATEFVAPESRDLIAQNILSGYRKPFQALGMRKDGSIFPGVFCAKPIPYQGRMVSVAVMRDISELKQAGEALHKAREELEARVEQRMQRGNPYGLTFRELTILHLVAAGRADKEIGFELGISVQTAQKHVANILSKMDASSRTAAGVRAVREGLLD
jgi:PAS domain S-box-containing protein